MSLYILVMILLVFPSYTTSPTLPLKLAVVLGLTPEQQAPLPGCEPIPIVTMIFFEPVPLILKLTRSAIGLGSVLPISDLPRGVAKFTIDANIKSARKSEVFFIRYTSLIVNVGISINTQIVELNLANQKGFTFSTINVKPKLI